LSKITVWIFLNKLKTQVDQQKSLWRRSCWFSRYINWMLKYQVSFSVVVETWNNVSYNWIFSPTNVGCWISNWNRKNFFFG
jgi:hypothetical protein